MVEQNDETHSDRDSQDGEKRSSGIDNRESNSRKRKIPTAFDAQHKKARLEPLEKYPSHPIPTELKSINPLPDELWMKIFGNLNPSDLAKAAAVSKDWYRIVNDNNLWGNSYRSDFNKKLSISPHFSMRTI